MLANTLLAVRSLSVRCEICGEWIAIVDPANLYDPMVGAMFFSVDPFHGFPPPFDPATEWAWMRCPYGAHRPFIEPNRILTDRGYLVLRQRAQDAAGGEAVTPEPMEMVEEPPISGEPTDDDAALPLPQALQDIAPPEPFLCPHCGREYVDEGACKRHVARAHKGKKWIPIRRRGEATDAA